MNNETEKTLAQIEALPDNAEANVIWPNVIQITCVQLQSLAAEYRANAERLRLAMECVERYADEDNWWTARNSITDQLRRELNVLYSPAVHANVQGYDYAQQTKQQIAAVGREGDDVCICGKHRQEHKWIRDSEVSSGGYWSCFGTDYVDTFKLRKSTPPKGKETE